MADSLLENYNPLYDIHLRQYFALPHMQKHLRRMGLLDSNGVPVAQNGNVESELYARHHAMMDMMLRNRERVLMQLSELQKKYDAAEKVEIYRRVRSGVTDADEFRRNHLSRSLSRPRRSATQPAKSSSSGRRRHSSNSFEDTEVIKRIETTYEQPQTATSAIKNTYDRLSANTFKYQFLHKLDDTTLINYKDSLQKQLQKLKRFRDISFGPHNVARHQTSQPASWFFRRRSLPSLSNSAPQNSLHSPIRSIKAAKDANGNNGHHQINGHASGSEEGRRRHGKSQSPRRHMQSTADRPRPRRAVSPTKRAATTHAGTRLPPINKDPPPLKPPRIPQKAAPTPEARKEEHQEKNAGILGKIAGGVTAAAAAVGGSVAAAAAAIGINDDEAPQKEASEEAMDTEDDEEEIIQRSPSPLRSPHTVGTPVQEAPPQHESSIPSPPPEEEPGSPARSPDLEEESYHRSPSPQQIHVTEASPPGSPVEGEPPREASLPVTPREASPENDENERHEPSSPQQPEEHSPLPSPQHEEPVHHSPSPQHESPSPQQHEQRSLLPSPHHEEDEPFHHATSPQREEPLHHSPSPQQHEQPSPLPSPHHEEEPPHHSPSPLESYREQHEEQVEQESQHQQKSPTPEEEEELSEAPHDHQPGRFDDLHAQKAHSFHEDDLREIQKEELISHDIEIEDTPNARDKRGASFEAADILARDDGEENHGVQDQVNGIGAELQDNSEEVEKLTEIRDSPHSQHHEEDDVVQEQVEDHATYHQNDDSFGGPENGDDHHFERDHETTRHFDNDSVHSQQESHRSAASPHHDVQHREVSPVLSHGASDPHEHGHPTADDIVSLDQEVTHQAAEEAMATEIERDDALEHDGHLNDDDVVTAAEPSHQESEQDNLDHHSNYAESYGDVRSERSIDGQGNHDNKSNYAESQGDAQSVRSVEDHDTHSNDAESHGDAQSTRSIHDQDIQDTHPNYAESQSDAQSVRSVEAHPHGNVMEQSIYQENHHDEHIQPHHDEHEAPLSPPLSPNPQDQDLMVRSFYPGSEHEEPANPGSPLHNPHEPIQAQEQAFEAGFISSPRNAESHHFNGIHEDEGTLEPPISNRSLESFQRHEEEVAADIQHMQEDEDIENRAPENNIAQPRGELLTQPSIEITAASDFGDSQVDDISAPPTPHSPQVGDSVGGHQPVFDHEVIEHGERDISDEEVNESSSLLANGHEGDHEEEDDDEDSGSVVMHKTPDSANFPQHHHHQQQYQRSDDEQSETGQGHL